MGTGILAVGQVTLQARGYVEEADKLFLVVADPVTRMWLESLNPTAESLADAYHEGRSRRETYHEMVERVLTPVRRGLDVCVAFYGHPGILVDASHEAIRKAREEGHNALMLPGISALDCLFADLGLDPGTCGCQVYEATDFLVSRRKVDVSSRLILLQAGAVGVRDYRRQSSAWNRPGLNVLEQVLKKLYPADHEVAVYEAALLPTSDLSLLRVPLEELAQSEISIGSTLYLPPLNRADADRAMADRLGLSHPT